MPKCILALDQGTSSSRAILFDHSGRPLAAAQEEFPQIYPRPGWVEHDPEAIWESQLRVAREALRSSGVSAADVAALGITNQRETTILWDRRTGRPIANAIVWQSRVTADLCQRLKDEGLEETFRRKTGLVIDPYFSGTKIAHLLDTVDGARAAAERGDVLFGTVDTFLVWRLTGGRLHVTDHTNASRTLIYNIHTLDWDDELLTVLRIPRAMLPEVRSSSEVYGETDAALLGAAIPVGGIAGDQQAATFGQGCFAPGTVKNTYGTGCFLLLNTGERPVESRHGLLTTIGWGLGGEVTYCLEGAIFIAGAALKWLRDGLAIIAGYDEVDRLAASIPDSGGVYFVPAFVGLGAPHWDPDARGTIVGITGGTKREQVVRAALEAMAYQTREIVDAMAADAGLPATSLQVDGGATRSDLLLQFQADLLGVPVRRPVVQETTALGAAYLAGLAVGYWRDREEIARNWALDREFQPVMWRGEADRLYARWQDAVRRSLAWERPS